MKLTILTALACFGTTMHASVLNDSTKEAIKLTEVVVTANHSAAQRMKEVQVGVEKIDIKKMAELPAIFGERDILKSIQMLPGVKNESEGSCGFQVRGGTSAQNLVLLDNAPLYNTGHLVGIFSAFNDDALATASLFKGQIPAKFGGASSSVLEVMTRPADLSEMHGGFSIGLLAAKAYFETPLVKDRVGVLLTARRSYFDQFLKASKEYKDNILNFYDLNGRLDFNLSPRHKAYLSFYHGHDNMAISDLMEMHWGNTTLVGGWNWMMGERLRLHSNVAYGYYGSDMGFYVADNNYKMDGHVRQLVWKEAFDWTPNDAHRVSFGLQGAWQQVLSAEWDAMTLHEKEEREAWNFNAWVNDEWTVSRALQMSVGMRYDRFRQFNHIEPRGSLKLNFGDCHSLKLGYSYTTQNIHVIRNSASSLPSDRYTVSTKTIRPELSHQLCLGYVGMTRDGDYDFSLEGYYKWIRNIYDYKDGKYYASDIAIENIVLGGKGKAYGLEFCTHKNNGRLTGWVSYTLSWSKNKIDGINQGRWYTASNDRRHDINVVMMQKLNKGWSLSSAFVFTSGQALTAPSAKYKVDGYTHYHYAERNGYRAPACHHLDVSASHTKRIGKRERQWTFGIYNLYGRENPYVVTFKENKDSNAGTTATQTALFGMLPFVAYSMKF